jgi:ADP-ribosylglycohydrolase
MIGALAGDIIGSVYEFRNWKGGINDFPLFTEKSTFTDDTVLSVATTEDMVVCLNVGLIQKIHNHIIVLVMAQQ